MRRGGKNETKKKRERDRETPLYVVIKNYETVINQTFLYFPDNESQKRMVLKYPSLHP